ncbi:galactose-1-epimerase [Massilia sp. G4R7]|uniref:Galactose-1-epimerase n=1 Tax=Massilia phyllostachyos TaxID=2898585 RepID=A0ABS8QB81_9BURK|nr:galactose-1-epimerase [Massilia phyllostachyos]MCD2519015.1 galactose-1-epimerase [Massilia phyllostachyos]
MESWPPPARLFTLRNRREMRVTISEHGAALVSWWAPDRYGRMADVLLGYRDDSDYACNTACLGAVVQRSGAAPRLHAPHWRGELDVGGTALRLRPSNLDGIGAGLAELEVRYELDDDGCLSVAYHALADSPALINLSTHACFNLNGGHADVGDHMLQIDADRFLATDAGGALRDLEVSGTPFDFRRPAPIGPRLRWPHEQIGAAGGFDHAYQVGASSSGIVRPVASIHDPGSGRRLQVSTTEGSLHFYSGNRLDGVPGRGAAPYERHAGFCLEAGASRVQRDGARAPGLLLGPGEVYRHTTVYRVSLQP